MTDFFLVFGDLLLFVLKLLFWMIFIICVVHAFVIAFHRNLSRSFPVGFAHPPSRREVAHRVIAAALIVPFLWLFSYT